MSWATRITLILGIPWVLLMLVILGSPPRGDAWLYGVIIIGGGPLVLVWGMFRLILGDRGVVYRAH